MRLQSNVILMDIIVHTTNIVLLSPIDESIETVSKAIIEEKWEV